MKHFSRNHADDGTMYGVFIQKRFLAVINKFPEDTIKY